MQAIIDVNNYTSLTGNVVVMKVGQHSIAYKYGRTSQVDIKW